MNTTRAASRSAVLTLVVMYIGFAVSSLTAAEPKEAVLIDFATVKRDPDGKVFRVYEYAYGDWDKHIVDLRGRGTLIQAATGKGGFGENKTMVQFGKHPTVDLHFVIGNANQAQTVNFSLEDKDGTEQTWIISLVGKPRGQPLRQLLDLGKADGEIKPGKTPGMNLKKMATWQVRGDYSDAKVELLLVKLTAQK
jgi:hypothetical protein